VSHHDEQLCPFSAHWRCYLKRRRTGSAPQRTPSRCSRELFVRQWLLMCGALQPVVRVASNASSRAPTRGALRDSLSDSEQ
jgi:hypothetical protein